MDPKEFESEVRRVARHRWPSASAGGSEYELGQERDGVFVTEDCVHLLECTCRREKAKAQTDLAKLFELYKHYRRSNPEKAIKCWFVTLFDPTADQRACRKEIKGAPEALFNIVSFAEFQSKLVDSFDYLQLREMHKFGSIYDPRTGGHSSKVKYVEVGLHCEGESGHRQVRDITTSMLRGSRYSVLGEYGVGKSMTLRELFRHLSSLHRERQTPLFPVYLNLREHQGQQEPAEMLERHGRNIGFPNPPQLVRAWKAGYVILLLDGFDEVSSLGLQGAWRRLKDARNASMSGVRRLVRESPDKAGVAVAGREHFFDTVEERKLAIGQSSIWKDIRLDEFSESQVRELARQFGYNGNVPSWVPGRPLLLSTLFAQGLDSNDMQLSTIIDPALGWDYLLDEICNREARIESGITGSNVRAILEALATLARSKDSALGPIQPDDIVRVFQSECGFIPTDEALIVMQRLPGLGRDSTGQEDSRAFVDAEFADACRAGDLVRFCNDPFNGDLGTRLCIARNTVGPTGIALAASKLKRGVFNEGKLTAAVRATAKMSSSGPGATPADLMQIALRLGLTIRSGMVVSQLLVDRLAVDENREDMHGVTFDDCYFANVELSPELTAATCPLFQNCLIQELEGRVSDKDLPAGRFDNCIIESFLSSAGTTGATLDLEIPVGARVLVTVLKKLFVQSVNGRMENALYRGLDPHHQGKVSAVLAILKSQAMVERSGRSGEPIWVPIRRQRSRALAIIGSPSASTDPAIVQSRKL